jgi:hypothetical protein
MKFTADYYKDGKVTLSITITASSLDDAKQKAQSGLALSGCDKFEITAK